MFGAQQQPQQLDEETQKANEILRERFLHVLNWLPGKQTQVKMFGSTIVEGRIGAVDAINFQHILVNQLQTPMGEIAHAALRVRDTVYIEISREKSTKQTANKQGEEQMEQQVDEESSSHEQMQGEIEKSGSNEVNNNVGESSDGQAEHIDIVMEQQKQCDRQKGEDRVEGNEENEQPVEEQVHADEQKQMAVKEKVDDDGIIEQDTTKVTAAASPFPCLNTFLSIFPGNRVDEKESADKNNDNNAVLNNQFANGEQNNSPIEVDTRIFDADDATGVLSFTTDQFFSQFRR